MFHSKDDILKVANTLSNKLIELCPQVRDHLKGNEKLLYELDSIIAMARCLTSDLGDQDNKNTAIEGTNF